MPSAKNEFWFPAKTYGYGWGQPRCWQGWLAMAIYFVALAANALANLPGQHTKRFVITAALLTLGLVFVAWLKGEKPHWRWSKDRD